METSTYSCMTSQQLEAEYQKVLTGFEHCKAQGLSLNMTRGKPSKKQLDLVSDFLTTLQKPGECFDDSIDSRNYGELAGLPCPRLCPSFPDW